MPANGVPILSSASASSLNITSDLSLVTAYTAAADCIVHMGIQLSALNTAAAQTITLHAKRKTSGGTLIMRLPPNPPAIAKYAAVDSVFGDVIIDIPLRSGEILEAHALSSSASDTAASATVILWNAASSNVHDWGQSGASCTIDGNGLPKIDVEDVGGTAAPKTAGRLTVTLSNASIAAILGASGFCAANKSTGNDGNDGTVDRPLATIAASLTQVGTGGRVWMQANESVIDTAISIPAGATIFASYGVTLAGTFTTDAASPQAGTGTFMTLSSDSGLDGVTVKGTGANLGSGESFICLTAGANTFYNNVIVNATNPDTGTLVAWSMTSGAIRGTRSTVTATGGIGRTTFSGTPRLFDGLTTSPFVGGTVTDFTAVDVGKMNHQAVTASGTLTFAGGGFGWGFATRSLTDKTGFTATASSLAAQAQTDVQSALTTQGLTAARAGYLDNLNIGGLVPTAAQIATQVEIQIMDDTDGHAVKQALIDKINATDTNLAGLTLAAIAAQVWGLARAGNSPAGSFGEAMVSAYGKLPAGNLPDTSSRMDLSAAALLRLVTDDTGHTTAAAGSVAKISQGAGGGVGTTENVEIEITNTTESVG